MNVVIKDIAKAAGVSTATVSNVLNGRKNVSNSTRERVLRICEEMDYQVNHAFLKMGKPQKIASYFGGKDGYLKAVKELEQAIYEGEIA